VTGDWGKSGEVSVRKLRALVYSIVLAVFCLSAVAEAQVSAEDRKRAAEAYDKGVQAFMNEDYAAAAHFFETAYRYAPAGVALLQATSMHAALGNDQRAANLALRLVMVHGDEGLDTSEAEEIIQEASETYARVNVTCDAACTVSASGSVQVHTTFFLEPSAREIAIVADFPGGKKSSKVKPEAGSTHDLAFEAPPPPKEAEPTVERVVVVQEAEPRGVNKSVFFTSLALAVGAGAGATATGIMTNNKKSDYDDTPASDLDRRQELYDQGKRLQNVTNGLAFSAAGVGVFSVIMAFVTDWSSKDKGSKDAKKDGSKPEVNATVTRNQLGLNLEGRF
jgi:hypothetical protein